MKKNVKFINENRIIATFPMLKVNFTKKNFI